MAKIGLSNFYYAVNTKDDDTGVTYNTPKKIPGLVSADIKAAANIATLYADNGPSEVASTLGQISVDIELKDHRLKIRPQY